MPGVNGDLVGDTSGGEEVWLSLAELMELMHGPLVRSLPPGAGCAFNVDGDRAWVRVGKPGDTRQVLAAARALRDEK